MPTEMFMIMVAAALVWRNRDQAVPDAGFLKATSSSPLAAPRG
jgi:hypothetical protein